MLSRAGDSVTSDQGKLFDFELCRLVRFVQGELFELVRCKLYREGFNVRSAESVNAFRVQARGMAPCGSDSGGQHCCGRELSNRAELHCPGERVEAGGPAPGAAKVPVPHVQEAHVVSGRKRNSINVLISFYSSP
jgi:hypothetical protein